MCHEGDFLHLKATTVTRQGDVRLLMIYNDETWGRSDSVEQAAHNLEM